MKTGSVNVTQTKLTGNQSLLSVATFLLEVSASELCLLNPRTDNGFLRAHCQAVQLCEETPI